MRSEALSVYGIRFIVAAVLFSGVTACDTRQQQEEFAEAASAPPSGYTRTDADGRVVEEDEDDWRTAPFYVGKIRVEPAYPNPTEGGFVTIPVSIMQFNEIVSFLVLRARNQSGTFVALDEIIDTSSPGAYIFSFSPGLIGRTGLVRLFVFDGTGEIVSYGDLLIE